MESIIESLTTVLQKLIDINPTIKICTWFNDSDMTDNHHLTSPRYFSLSSIQTASLNELNVFFHHINWKISKDLKNIWMDFKMEHSIRWKELQPKIGRWMQHCQIGLYKKALQTTKETVIGWIQWSFREIDAAVLASALNRDYGLQIYFRWSIIKIGTIYKNPDDHVRVLHVITTPEEADRTASLFDKLYHPDRTSFPLGIKLRFNDSILRQQVLDGV
jgi:hypothetical protein